jgi:A/G-specific adenine glycosylase
VHRCANAIVERHGGVVPDDLAALTALPGVGPYTARAVLAFAFGRSAAPVDTNIARVLARLVAGRPLGRAEAQRLADDLVPDDAATWSSALMDLGASVCRARSPRCDACPVPDRCAWHLDGGPDPAAAGAHRPRPQGRFDGSDRRHRGRLVDALRAGPLEAADVAAAIGSQEATRIAAALVADGLAEWDGTRLKLPG